MGRIELRGIAHRYSGDARTEDNYALKPLDLVWQPGGAYALLGPSGCGKTTLLNIISGLVRPTDGAVLIDGKDVTDASPQARNIAQVFQFPVIYDTMTVFDNLAFPLRNRGVAERETRQRVEQIAELLALGTELRRRASGLTADLKQRISLGRGLVRRDVAAILLDEPLTVIDPHAKSSLRRILMQIHSELRVTLIYVTHDQVEALTLADQVVVMNQGRVLQQGSPQELFERPAHTFVGYFIGSPGMNFLPCSLQDGAAIVEGQAFPLPPATVAAAPAATAAFALGVRPEFVRLSPRSDGAGAGSLAGTVTRVDHLGPYELATVRVGEKTVAAKLAEGQPLRVGDPCSVELAPEWTALYADGRRLP
jgi:glycerol transport system ATP-binding protein